MEPESFKTPNKLFLSPRIRALTHNNQVGTSPTVGRKQQQTQNKFHLIPIINASSPATRFPHIFNPFEQHLADRLHLPAICSPSLFQRPTTPQKNSTQFEWTIEDVSSLAPANVEVSELQFQTSHDPDLEARAQAAISSYFKENDIVPSPVDCSLRKHKIILQDSSVNMSVRETGSAARMKKKTRDGSSQTMLTFPPVLTKEMENLLKPFFTFVQEQQQSPSLDCDTTVDYEARDASLRRKLFDISVGACSGDEIDSLADFDPQALSPPPKTPEIPFENKIASTTRNFGSPLATNLSREVSLSPVKQESFGALSPISRLSSLTPNRRLSNKNRMTKANDSSLYRSTPERGEITEMSVDLTFLQQSLRSGQAQMSPDDNKENIEDWGNLSYDDMISSTMNKSARMSSAAVRQKTVTPVRKKKFAGKNLSHSFSQFCGSSEMSTIDEDGDSQPATVSSAPDKLVRFYTCDSGFNEGSCNGEFYSEMVVYENNLDVSMRSDF